MSLRAVLLIGSPTRQSRLYGLTSYVQEALVRQGIEVETVAVAELPAEDLLHANFNSPQVQHALHLVDRAEIVVAASPVYKAAYSGALKTLLDLLPQKGLKGKQILPLFIGGSLAHLLAVDYALKPVLSALGATHLLSGVYAVDSWISRTAEGGFELTEELRERLDQALEELQQESLRYANR